MRGFGTRGRFRVAAVGLPAATVPGAAPSSGRCAAVTQWNVQGNGGFVSLGLLNSIQIAGGGSEADASSSRLAESSGTGLCLDTTAASNPCPITATSSLSGEALKSTQQAVARATV